MLASSHGFAWRPASIAVRSPRRVLTLPYSSASCDDHLETVLVRFLFHPLSRHCFGAIAAPGACGASALPLPPFRFWLPRAGSPEKQLLVLGAAPTRFRVPETDGQNRRNVCTSTESLSSVSSAAMPKKGQQRNEHRGVLARHQDVVEE